MPKFCGYRELRGINPEDFFLVYTLPLFGIIILYFCYKRLKLSIMERFDYELQKAENNNG